MDGTYSTYAHPPPYAFGLTDFRWVRVSRRRSPYASTNLISLPRFVSYCRR